MSEKENENLNQLRLAIYYLEKDLNQLRAVMKRLIKMGLVEEDKHYCGVEEKVVLRLSWTERKEEIGGGIIGDFDLNFLKFL